VPTSGIEDVAMRLLGAFYDVSGQDPTRPVPIGGSDSPPGEGAAPKAGIDASSTEPDVAVRYLLDQGYLQQADAPSAYTITVAGIDKVREMRGLAQPTTPTGTGLSDQTQRRLLSVLALVTAAVLTRPVNRFITEQIPERRGIRDDLQEAVLKGLVRMAAYFAASLVVRRLAQMRR
jgi:hypothetical protein